MIAHSMHVKSWCFFTPLVYHCCALYRCHVATFIERKRHTRIKQTLTVLEWNECWQKKTWWTKKTPSTTKWGCVTEKLINGIKQFWSCCERCLSTSWIALNLCDEVRNPQCTTTLNVRVSIRTNYDFVFATFENESNVVSIRFENSSVSTKSINVTVLDSSSPISGSIYVA